MRPYCEQPSVEPRCAECLNLLLPDLGLGFSWGLVDWGWSALGCLGGASAGLGLRSQGSFGRFELSRCRAFEK